MQSNAVRDLAGFTGSEDEWNANYCGGFTESSWMFINFVAANAFEVFGVMTNRALKSFVAQAC